MAKRIGLFLLVNILIMITFSIITSILGVNRYLTPYGINYISLAIFCLIWGMGGAFLSLFISKFIAKKLMGIQIIDPAKPGQYSELVSSISRLSSLAKIPMPEIGIYDSPELNAFATGASRKSSLVAVSSGLMRAMNKNELEGVLAHEISHIANGDMVTMTLLAGVVNAFTMFLSRIISFAVSRMVNEDIAVIVRIVLTVVLDIVFSILGSIVVMYYSRVREFSADRGGADLSSRQNMIAALENLQKNFQPVDNRGASMASFKIADKKALLSLFSSHPPLEKRIEALKFGK